MSEMSFEEFVIDWQDYAARNLSQRDGQALSNYLALIDKGLFFILADAGLDPFFDDAGVPDALAFIKEHWNG